MEGKKLENWFGDFLKCRKDGHISTGLQLTQCVEEKKLPGLDFCGRCKLPYLRGLTEAEKRNYKKKLNERMY